MTDAERASGLPTGVIAAIVFGVALVLLLLLFRGEDEGSVEIVSLRGYHPEEIEESVAERLDLVELRPSRVLRVTGTEIEWRDPSGRPFLQTRRVTVSIELGAPPDGAIVISNGVVVEPRLRLVQTGVESWNYDRPLAALIGEERPGAPAVRMRNITLDRGYIRLDRLDGTYYEARSLDARLASARLSGPGVDAPEFHVASAAAQLVLPDTTAEGRIQRDATLADARIRLVNGAVPFQVERATFGQSRLANAVGVWDPALGGLGLDMRVTAVEARVADLPWLPGDVPEGARGSFELRLVPRPGGRTAVALSELDITAPGSSVRGMIRAVIGGARPVLEAVDLRVDPLSLELVQAFTGPFPYAGTVTGTVRGTGADIRFDLRGRLTTVTVPEPFTVDLAGNVALTDAGVELLGADISLDQTPLAALDAIAPGLPFQGPITGTVLLTGPPGEGPVRLNLRLEAGGGVVTVAGTADLSGAEPRYDLTGRLAGVRLQSVLRPSVPPAEVHARFELAGRGIDPATAVASVAARGHFTGWRTEPGDTLVVVADLAGGALDVEDLRLRLGPVEAEAAGAWNFVDGTGGFSYQVAVSDLDPLGPFLPADAQGQRRFATGSLQLAGSVGGTLEAPVVAGEATARDFRWGEWAAESLDAEYSVDLAEGLPRVDADVTAAELRTPVGDFTAVELVADFGRPTFEVSFRADQPDDRGILAVEAGGRIEESGRREVVVRTVAVDLQRQRWGLLEPARIAWTDGEAVEIRDMQLVQTNGDGRIAVGGTLAPLDAMDLSVDVVRLPVEALAELTGIGTDVAGDLTLNGRVAGPADAPAVDVRLELLDGVFRGIAVRTVEGMIRYEDDRLIVEGSGLLGDSARLELTGSLPARIRLAGTPLFGLMDDGPIDLRIVTQTFPLATLDPGLASVEDIEGRVEADLQVGGTPTAPRLSGFARIADGAATIPLLERRFTGIRGRVELSGRQAAIRDMVVESDGTASLRGTLTFEELTNPGLDLAADFQRFRVQGIDDEAPAGLWGTVELTGSARQPVMTGSVRVDDGAISLAPFRQPDLAARLTGTGSAALLDPAADFDLSDPDDGGGVVIRGLQISAGNNLWFVTEEARARLSGTLTVDKFGGSTPIQGTLQGEGGTFDLAAGPINRQFQIVSAEIRFFGSPEPNPRLDVVASRLVRTRNGGDVDVRIHVGGTLNNPSLNLATASEADIPESELLSFLLFGRPSTDLGEVAAGEGGGGFLGQSLAYSGVFDVLSSRVNQELGFVDYLQVDYLPGGGFYLTAGVELRTNLFLNADIPMTAETDIWALGLEWDLGSTGILRGAIEPVERLDRLIGLRSQSFLEAELKRQAALSWRMRWTY